MTEMTMVRPAIVRVTRARTIPLAIFKTPAHCRAALSGGLERFLENHCHDGKSISGGWNEYMGGFCLPSLRITPDDVATGIRRDPYRCPSSIAAKRTPLGRRADFVVSSKTTTKFIFEKEQVIIKMTNDARLADAIGFFDETGNWLHQSAVYDLLPARRYKKPAVPYNRTGQKQSRIHTRAVVRSSEIVAQLSSKKEKLAAPKPGIFEVAITEAIAQLMWLNNLDGKEKLAAPKPGSFESAITEAIAQLMWLNNLDSNAMLPEDRRIMTQIVTGFYKYVVDEMLPKEHPPALKKRIRRIANSLVA